MGNELLSSKIVIQEPPPQVRTLSGSNTATALFIGVAEWGPVGTPVELTSWEDYVKTFGGFSANAQDLPMGVRGFFLNGGQHAWVVRTVHYTTIGTPGSAQGTKATVSLKDKSGGGGINTLRVDGKYVGVRGNNLSVKIAAATSGDSDEFNLTVLEGGIVKEVFPNLSITDADANYAETVINDAKTGSALIAVVDLDSATATPNDIPTNGTFALATGNDGLTSLADADFTGDPVGTGLYAFDVVTGGRLLLAPGRATSAVHLALQDYAETWRGGSMFAILATPESNSASQMVTYVKTTAALLNRSEFSAIYWPKIKVVNPSTSVFGKASLVLTDPSGFIAGLCANTDGLRQGGVYDAPAGVERGILRGVVGLETDEVLKEAARDLVYPARINPITQLPGTPFFVDGNRTLKSGGNFPSIPERRGVIFIEQAVKDGLLFAKHTNNDERLRRTVNRTITSFLLRQMRDGAFASQKPEEAFFVDTSTAINTPSVVAAGILKVRVGLATNKPTDYIVLEFTQDTRRLDEEAALA